MRTVLKAGFLLVMALLSVPVSGEPAEIRTIHIVTPAWPDQTNEDGSGLFFDIVRSIYEPAGIKMKYEIVPWKRAESMLRSDKADAMVDVLRVNALLTPEHPVNVIQKYAVFKKRNVPKWEGVKSLSGKKVLWFRGYDFHKNQHLKDVKFRWDEIDEYATAWKMLERDRADFYIDVFPDIEKFVKNNSINMEPYRIERLWSEKTYMSFAKSEKSKKLIEIYDRRIMEMYGSGELKKIFEKWNYRFLPDAWKK